MDKEIWKDIEGYKGKYQVSNLGRVRSLINTRRNTLNEPKLRKLKIDRKGYINVNFKEGRKNICLKVHRLVAQAFIPNPENKPQVNHRDGNKQNNCVDNLEWVTQSENIKHAFKNNLNKAKRGDSAYQAALTNIEADKIRKEYIPYSKNFNRKKLSEKYGVSLSIIKNVVNGKTYKE